MRIAALFLGLIAGLFALLAPSALRVDLMSPFLDFWTHSSNERLLGTIIWYAVAGAALLGGVLATVTPGFAALLLIGAAAGWLGIAISMPQLFTYHLLAPAGTAGIAALFAFLAGELQVRRRRQARRNRRLAVEAPDENDSEFEREAALRMDPMLMPRHDVPPPPKRAIPLTLDDVTVTSRPTTTPPRWEDLDAPPPPRRHDPDMWAEARREQLEPTEAPRARVAPEPRAETWEREPEVRRREPDGPGRERAPRRGPEARPEQQRRSSERDQRGNIWVAILAAIVAVLGIGIIAAGGYLINRDGSLDALFGQPGAPAPVLSTDAGKTPAPAAEPEVASRIAATPAPAAKLELPAAPAVAASTPPTPAAAEAEPAIAPARVAAAPSAGSYDDPFAYCRAVGTIDYIDNRYVGPAVTSAIAQALLVPPGSARDRVRWRCVSGAVLACTSYIGPICDMAPTVVEMREFCERNPNVEQLLAPSGTWACVDGKPQLPADARWPIDERGFLPQGWIRVPDGASATAG
ncbi:MAG TPA: hypothetical protein VGV07_04255 [Devosia sp.]|uniref:hypothetical protein n=1 Tax=Devosia sp. TaxID=1871048 RepID=UPI002DDD66B5|nr:hypothetical protein [Devosia sp.]HEV2514437.1 hypothetical protein [Devosia sp.]